MANKNNKKPVFNMPIPRIEVISTDPVIYKKAKLAGIPPLQAKIIANRKIPSYIHPKDIYNPSLSGLDVSKLKDISKSAARICDAIINKEIIALVCDFDVDGISSAAVLYKSFVDYFNCIPILIKPAISNRMKAGYGFSDDVLDRILEMNPEPTLIITADQGSKDNPRVIRYNSEMKKRGFENASVIITDHHHIDGEGPPDAYAVVNPQRKDCQFVDKTICGCTVALFVMVEVREQLIKRGYLEENSEKLSSLLTYSTAATIADCVSMASPLNRSIVNYGLKDMNNGTKAPWRVMKKLFSDEAQVIRTDSIGFGLAPRINACSRTGGDGLVALKFYISDSDVEAERYLSMLDFQNDERKDIEKRLLLEAMEASSNYYTQGKNSLVIYLKDGHHGVHGIVASRIVEKYGRPVICLSPKEFTEETITVEDTSGKIKKTKKEKVKNVITVSGSARSIEGLDIHQCLENAQKKFPKLFLGFGGHPMAAGMTIKFEDVELLRLAIEEEVSNALTHKPHPVFHVDGEIKNKEIDLDFVDEILRLEPYGNNFAYPKFKIIGKINKIEIKGKNRDTGFFDIVFNNKVYKSSIWFKYDQSPMFQKIKENDTCEFVISIREKLWKGVRSSQIQIEHAIPLDME